MRDQAWEAHTFARTVRCIHHLQVQGLRKAMFDMTLEELTCLKILLQKLDRNRHSCAYDYFESQKAQQLVVVVDGLIKKIQNQEML